MIDSKPTDCSYAQLILPTLRRIRAARACADGLARRTADAGRLACAERARSTIAALDQTLRAAGLYDLAQPDLLEKDAARREQASRLIDEARGQLRRLAVELCAEPGCAGDDVALAELVSTLDEGA